MDLRVPFSLLLSAFGVTATVTRPAPDDEPIDTAVVWVTPLTQDVPSGLEFSRRDPIRALAVSRADVATVPRGTVIAAPERAGDPVRAWKVDSTEVADADHVRVLVIRAPELEA